MNGVLDLSNPRIRAAWAALPPGILAFAFSVSLPMKTHGMLASLKSPFEQFLTLSEAEAFDVNDTPAFLGSPASRWPHLVFASVGIGQMLAWLAYASYAFLAPDISLAAALLPLLVATVWLYSVVRAVFNLSLTPPYDIFACYLLLLIGAVLQLGGVLYDHAVGAAPWPGVVVLAVLAANLGCVVFVLGVLLGMPVGVPSERVNIEEIGKSVSAEDYTTLFGWVTFHWVYPLIHRGRYKTLEEEDVPNMSPTMQSRPVFLKFITMQRSSLFWTILATNSFDVIIDFVFTFVAIVLRYASPFFLKRILDGIAIPNPTPKERTPLYVYAFLAFICVLLVSETELQHLWYGRRAATRIRSALMAVIYDKTLKRTYISGAPNTDKESGKETWDQKINKDKNDPKVGADVGKIVNLMAGDANLISTTASSMYLLYGAPFEILIAGFSLYKLLGLSAFAGFIIFVVLWPLNVWVTRRRITIRKELFTAKDARMGVLSELVGAIKFIKLFAWEDKWIDRTLDSREKELRWLRREQLNTVQLHAVFTAAPVLVAIISFTVFVMSGNELTVGIAFTAIALFKMIGAPLNSIPTWIANVVQVNVSLKRIAVYLDEVEVSEQVSSLKEAAVTPRDDEPANGYNTGLGIMNGSFRWNAVPGGKEGKGKNRAEDRESSAHLAVSTAMTEEGETALLLPADEAPKFELRDINVMFPEDKLTVITGPTASGKTALLMALLGEMTTLPTFPPGKLVLTKDPHKVDEHGLIHTVSYAAQTPWIRHQSIRDNILFGQVYEEGRYKDVVECCALESDFEVLEDGDRTEVGTRGANLSGGQRARVALARAVYARTKYVLLDDPLSAVDGHTARFLFERLLCGPLLAHRTVILVTHHASLVLPGAHYFVRMRGGCIDMQGTVKELRAQGLLEGIEVDDITIEDRKEEFVEAKEGRVEEEIEQGENKGKTTPPRELVKDEHREVGGVKWVIYKTYIKAVSYWIYALLIVIMAFWQVSDLAEKIWIMIWGEAYGQVGASSSHTHLDWLFRSVTSDAGIQWPNALEHPLFYVGVYAMIRLGTAFMDVFLVFAKYTGSLRASRSLFKQLLNSVVRATFRFFDTTPQGRILNRFDKDIEAIDMTLVASLQIVNLSLGNLLTSVVTVIFVFPAFLLPAIVIGFAYYQLSVGYIETGRDLRRMEANTRSPIFSEFAELLEGIVTVRAFSAERRFLDNVHLKIDITTKMWYSFWMINRWLLLNFDVLGATAVLITTLFSITTMNGRAGIAGLSITTAMSFTWAVYWSCRDLTSLELDLNSVERIVEYLDLPQEPPEIVESNRVPAYWPSSAKDDTLVSVENLVVHYAPDLPAVLRDVSFTLKSGERIGVLGRTGSGKSTLAMSLLRFIDPLSGRIVIDGIDISKIGIRELRSRITFIPQDATLFSGTLRDNLDPFVEHNDVECLDVLRRVQMIEALSQTAPSASSSQVPSIHMWERDEWTSLSTTIGGDRILKTPVSPGGTNFSQGQRQLIAMARALLRRNSIIILDEATSSMDFATDARIQTAVREQFKDSLLLTIAHRLWTVIDYDRLIVMDNGRVAELDTPWRLIQNDGIFRNMCFKSGSFGELEAAARVKAARDGLL